MFLTATLLLTVLGMVASPIAVQRAKGRGELHRAWAYGVAGDYAALAFLICLALATPLPVVRFFALLLAVMEMFVIRYRWRKRPQ